MAARGDQVPSGWILDADGKPTTDPSSLKACGVLLPLGGIKLIKAMDYCND